jgi:hypothetical protein
MGRPLETSSFSYLGSINICHILADLRVFDNYVSAYDFPFLLIWTAKMVGFIRC